MHTNDLADLHEYPAGMDALDMAYSGVTKYVKKHKFNLEETRAMAHEAMRRLMNPITFKIPEPEPFKYSYDAVPFRKILKSVNIAPIGLDMFFASSKAAEEYLHWYWGEVNRAVRAELNNRDFVFGKNEIDGKGSIW